MSTPPHSVDSLPPPLCNDQFTSRNNFLLLILGVIATAERVLEFMPELAVEGGDVSQFSSVKTPIKPEATGKTDSSLLR